MDWDSSIHKTEHPRTLNPPGSLGAEPLNSARKRVGVIGGGAQPTEFRGNNPCSERGFVPPPNMEAFMAKKKYVWEVHLRPNTLTKDNDRDCIADVHAHAATQRNEDIAEIITKERSEFRKETIINILNMRDKAVKDIIQEGLSFMDGLVQISPRVSGVWETENSPYDEKVHKRTVDLVPTTDLRTALDAIGVKVLGAKEETARITEITDTATGLKDGTLTIGDDIIIEGSKIKVDETDPAQGVFFKAADGTEYKTNRRLSVNLPSQIIARVPKEVPEGKVEVMVRTKFSTGNKTLLQIREIVYGYPCKAKA